MATKTLYVGNLPYSVNETTLAAHFSKYGSSNVRIVEGRGATVMEIWRRCRHIAQARYPHDVGLPQDERAEDSLPLEQIASDVNALMAGTAAERFEHPIAVKFLRRQRRGIAVQPAIEPASRRKQRSFKGH